VRINAAVPRRVRKGLPSMKRFAILFGFGALVLVNAAPARAQVCGGGASFAANPYQVNLSYLTNDAEKVTTVGGGIGGSTWWGQAGLALTSFANVDGTAKGAFVNIGGDFAVDSDKKFYACPILSFARTGGINVPGVDSSSNLFSFGGAVGYRVGQSSSVSVIPTAAVFIDHQSFSASTSAGNTTLSADTSENYGTLQLGVGLVFSEKFAVAPKVVIPFGLDGGKTSFVVDAAFNFGK
jgi:hypothetical protein